MPVGRSHLVAWVYALCLAAVLIVVISVGLVVIYFTPVTYTYLWGDENTRRLYHAYRYAASHPDIESMEAYLVESRSKYNRDERKRVIIIYSTTAAEAVYIYYEGDRVTKAVFSPD